MRRIDYDSCRTLAAAELERTKGAALKNILKALKLEKNPLFTQNTHYLDSVRSAWLERYKKARKNHVDYLLGQPRVAREYVDMDYPGESLLRAVDTRAQRALDALASLGYRHICEQDFVRLHPPDAFDEELTVMADVRAYFQVAFKVHFRDLASTSLIPYSPSTSFFSLTHTASHRLHPSDHRAFAQPAARGYAAEEHRAAVQFWRCGCE